MLTRGEEKPKFDNLIILFFILLFAADALVWQQVAFGKNSTHPAIHFMDVGQGDSELAIFPGNVKVLTDAGPDSKITGELEKIPALADKYIDIAVITHPQLDHFGGFEYLLDRYRIGAFVYNGRSDSPGVEEWTNLIKKISGKNIPLIKLGSGDAIKYTGSRIDFLSPNASLAQSQELNDTGLIEMMNFGEIKALLVADIDSATENYLANRFDLQADILKVAHHGSKYSASQAFLNSVKPKIAVIEVGARNNYGHPALETLKMLSSLASVFRTDKNGQITITEADKKLKVFTSK
ncbi:MAG TPA: MBL fold metallo-hydrolase [Candidatus Paceibacterota bacterium]|nr:MBL fold metallo-hydrolase [Candidatus Paceibacterota bacterium]